MAVHSIPLHFLFLFQKKEDASGKKENVRAFNKPKMPECFFKKKLSESVCVPTPGVKNEIIVCVPRGGGKNESRGEKPKKNLYDCFSRTQCDKQTHRHHTKNSKMRVSFSAAANNCIG